MRTARAWMAAMLAAALVAPAGAGTYTVDATADTSSTQFRTVEGGVRQLARPGDQLTIRRGVYVGRVVIKGLKGAPDRPIVIHGERGAVPADEANDPGAIIKYSPVLKAENKDSEVRPPDNKSIEFRAEINNVLVLKDCANLTIDNLVFTGAKGAGVVLDNCDHITFRDCDIVDNVYSQVQVKAGDHITLDGCELSGSVVGHGSRFWMSDNPIVRNCLIHHNASAGVNIDGDKGSGGDGLITDAVVENNVLFANGKQRPGVRGPVDEKGREIQPIRLRYGAAAIALDGAEHATVRNNLVYRNFQGGIVLYRDFGLRAGQHSRVLHNTVYLPADSGGAYGLYLALMTQDTSVYNNILVTASGPVIWLGSGATRDLKSDGNILFRLDNKDPLRRDKEDLSLARWQELFRLERGSMLFNPPFVDAENEDSLKCDFTPKTEAKLGGKCLFNWEAPTDCLGNWRPKEKVTPGCYELNPTERKANAPKSAFSRLPGGQTKTGGSASPEPTPSPSPSPSPSPTEIPLPPI